MQTQKEACCCQCGEDKALYDEVAKVIEKYEGTDGALIMVLHEAQEIFGYLPMELQKFVADKMDIPVSDVNGVVSFYSFFTPTKRGKHTIRVCQGTACYVRGGKKLVNAICDTLNVETDGTTEDGQFTFEIARCIGACGLAPAVMIDDDVYKQVTPQKLPGILALYQDEEEAEGGAEA
ncbi:MAG: NAD(P)H-dependent oxidoreductase subunit E [Lachnospiraceae bacterium]|nr:NAD(P)H-dependent oxidoreductase subunit E [Lachnospiraceae bacterium]